MSTMNILSITLIVLILAACAALFLGMRAAQADEGTTPIFIPAPSVSANAAPDTMDDTTPAMDLQ